ncbi:MAG: hypothetical protein ACI4WT_14550 [Oligosphaeraceae bacterium]
MSALMLLLGVFIPFVIIVLFLLLLLGMCVVVACIIWSLLRNDPYRFNAAVQSFYLAHDGICLKVREKVKGGQGRRGGGSRFGRFGEGEPVSHRQQADSREGRTLTHLSLFC